MNKKLLIESIKSIEESMKTSHDNLEKSKQHIFEGELFLKALKGELEKFK